MLYVDLKGDKNLALSPQTVEWHIGQTLRVAPWEVERVKAVQADGDELEFITGQFKDSIPNSRQRIQAWYGDTAKSIVFSLIK